MSPKTPRFIDNSSLFSTLPLLLAVLSYSTVAADDIPAPTQEKGQHSAVQTSDGTVRDDEFIDFICQKIKENGGKVKDVKLLVNSCYGGGLLDDMEKAFGPGGACEGIPWVAGSASLPDQTARGADDAAVKNNPTHSLGSSWTDALAGNSGQNLVSKTGVIREGSSTNNVLQDLIAAGKNDYAGPDGQKMETPQVASGNGGDKIMWNMEGAKHEAVVFAGNNNKERHHKNIENMTIALENTWPEGSHYVREYDGGTKKDLFDAIEDAASSLDENTQLVIYIDDHGASSVDVDETKGNVADTVIEEAQSWILHFPHGWFTGWWGNFFGNPFEMPDPALEMYITQCVGCYYWGYKINGVPLTFPGGDQTGMVRLPIPWYIMSSGYNRLDIIPRSAPPMLQATDGKPQAGMGSLMVSRMEISSGPVDELEWSVLQPGQSAAFYDPTRSGEGIFVELLDEERALVYMFTFDQTGEHQAWMLGLGIQTGSGIIVDNFVMPTGATFGPDFDPEDVVRTDIGPVTFLLPTCGTSALTGVLFVYPNGSTGYSLFANFNYVQLTSIVSCDDAVGSANSPLSGSWFDPTHDGEGIILEVLENGTAVVQWFTYDSEGNQMWIQGTGTFDGNKLTVENLYTTQGTQWGALFDPAAIVQTPWGSLTMEFTGCGVATVMYNSTAGFGAGTLNMQRVTNLMGIPCEE
jgi:hypothetical protein